MALADIFAPKILKKIKNIEESGLTPAIATAGELITPFAPLAIDGNGKLRNANTDVDTHHQATDVSDMYASGYGNYHNKVLKIGGSRIVRIYLSSADNAHFIMELVDLNPTTNTIDILDSLDIDIGTAYGSSYYIGCEYDPITNRIALASKDKISGIQITGDSLSLIAQVDVDYINYSYPIVIAFENGVGMVLSEKENTTPRFEMTSSAINVDIFDAELNGSYTVRDATGMMKHSPLNYYYQSYEYTYKIVLDDTDYTQSTIENITTTDRNYAMTTWIDGDYLYGFYASSSYTYLRFFWLNVVTLDHGEHQIPLDGVIDSTLYYRYDNPTIVSSKDGALQMPNGTTLMYVLAYGAQVGKKGRLFQMVTEGKQMPTLSIINNLYLSEAESDGNNVCVMSIYDDATDTFIFYNPNYQNNSAPDNQYVDWVTSFDSFDSTAVEGFCVKTYNIDDVATILGDYKAYPTKEFTAGQRLPNGYITTDKDMIVKEKK